MGWCFSGGCQGESRGSQILPIFPRAGYSPVLARPPHSQGPSQELRASGTGIVTVTLLDPKSRRQRGHSPSGPYSCPSFPSTCSWACHAPAP